MADFGKLNFSVSFNPTSGFPIDARYYFDTLEAAKTAAAGAVEVGSADGVYFYGMNLVVVEDNVATLYVIQPDKTLKPVGTTPVGDNKTISVSEDGIISLMGIADAQTGAYPSKKADGSIEWVKPDTTTIEGVSQEVEALGGRVDTTEREIATLKETVGDSGKGLVKQVNDLSTNLTENYYDKDEVNGLVAGAFHFKGAADSFNGTDIIISGQPVADMKAGDVYQVGDKEYVYDGTKWIELGFTIDLSNYALKTYVDSAVSTAKTELQSYADQAETDAINTAKEYTNTQITELKIDDYAKKTDVASNIETAKTELKQYTDQSKIEAINAAGAAADSKISAKVGDVGEGTVKAYVDTKEAALSGRIDSLGTQIGNLGDLASLDEVAESNLANALSTKINNKADKATTLAGYGITDAMTASAISDTISTAKGEAVSDAGAQTDAKISTKVGTITGTVKDYVDSKETSLNGKIETINTTIGKYGDIVTHNSDEFDTKGSGQAAANAVLGAEEDASTANTVYGAKKGVEEAKAAAKNAETTAASKVASIKAGDNSVTIGGTPTAPTVSVKVNQGEDNALKVTETGLKVELGAAPEYTIKKEASATEGYFATYTLTKDGVDTGAKIDIPKDYLVKSALIKESLGEEDPSGLPAGTKYIDFIINAKEGEGQESHIYLNVNELVDAITAGNGIEISSENQISVKVVTANGLSVDATGIKMSLASTLNAGAISATDYNKLQSVEDNAQANKIESITVNGEALSISNKVVALPMATAQKAGLVKPGTEFSISSDGEISITSINLRKIEQTLGDVIILDCNSSVSS